jgi:hypothetical protein
MEANPAINIDDKSSRVQEKRKHSETAENEGELVDCKATSDEADPVSHIDEASNRMQKNTQRQQKMWKIVRLQKMRGAC